MRAVLCSELGGVDDLRLVDRPEPVSPGPHQVKLRIAAAGLNFADLLVIAGKYQVKPPMPFTPGFEVAGVVEEVGTGVTHVKAGDRVMAILDHGGYAEAATADADLVFPAPKALDAAEAAGFPIAYGTSYLALVEKARLQSGETLLVHGAAGGVGLTAVEIGKALGAKVIATAGGADKCAIAEAHGADHVIDYKVEDIKDAVKAITPGVDVVYDPVGGSTFDASLRVVNWNARLLIVGFAAGDVQQIPGNILLVKNADALGFYFGSYRKHRPDLVARAFGELNKLLEAGRLKPLVSHRLELADFAEAMRLVQSRKSTGKVVLVTGVPF